MVSWGKKAKINLSKGHRVSIKNIGVEKNTSVVYNYFFKLLCASLCGLVIQVLLIFYPVFIGTKHKETFSQYNPQAEVKCYLKKCFVWSWVLVEYILI